MSKHASCLGFEHTFLDLVCFHCSSWLSLGRWNSNVFSQELVFFILDSLKEESLWYKWNKQSLASLAFNYLWFLPVCLSDINAKWWFDHGETPPCAREKNGAVGLRGPQPWQHAGWSDLDLLGIPPSEPHLDHSSLSLVDTVWHSDTTKISLKQVNFIR